MAWTEIRAAIKETLTEAGFAVRESKGVAEAGDRYVVIVSGNETNLDTGNYTGTNQYRNRREFSLWIYNKSPKGITDIDLVKQTVRDELEEVLQELKKIFNSTYNKIGEAGGVILKYDGMQFIDTPVSGIYAPVRMQVNYTVQFFEDRHIKQ
jgi:hypothetical protein